MAHGELETFISSSSPSMGREKECSLKNKEAQLKQGLARNSAATYIANAFEVALGENSNFKVIDLGANRKHICNFLLVINSKFGCFSYRFRDTDA